MSMSWPVDAPVSQQFASSPNSIQPNGHTGIDFAVSPNTPIHAADSGTVMFADWASVLSASNQWWIAPAFAGICVVINHNDGFLTLYAHLNSTDLNAGQFVEKGQLIGLSGSTGLSTGPHLHFEVLGWPLQPYNGFYGRLNPNVHVGGLAMAARLEGNQRVVGAPGAKERTAATTKSAEGRLFEHGDALTFKGFVKGESVNGSDIWFVGAFTGTFFHSSAFDDSGTHDLPDLTPKEAPVSLGTGQRRILTAQAFYRETPSVNGKLIQTYKKGDILNFSEFARGDNFQNTDIWLKGSISGGYMWAGAVEGGSATTGLTEEKKNTGPALSATQRKIAAETGWYRKSPKLNGEVIQQYNKGDVLNFSQYVVGDSFMNNNIWFKGAISGGYMWSGAFDGGANTKGLTLEKVASTPTPTPTPSEPATGSYSFKKDFDFVEYIPAAAPNLQQGNFPTNQTDVVIHQFGTLGVDTVNSTVNTFTNPNMDRVASAHFVVSGKRIIQMVSLNDRAYHAGSVGNNYVGIETDPAQDADTIASTKKLLAALRDKYGKELTKHLHKNVPGNSTNCGASITLSKYDLDKVAKPTPTPTPDVKPVTPPVVAPTPAVDAEKVIDNFLANLKRNNFQK